LISFVRLSSVRNKGRLTKPYFQLLSYMNRAEQWFRAFPDSQTGKVGVGSLRTGAHCTV